MPSLLATAGDRLFAWQGKGADSTAGPALVALGINKRPTGAGFEAVRPSPVLNFVPRAPCLPRRHRLGGGGGVGARLVAAAAAAPPPED